MIRPPFQVLAHKERHDARSMFLIAYTPEDYACQPNAGQPQLVDATNRLNTSDGFIQPNVY